MVYDKWNRLTFPLLISVIELLAGSKLILGSISGWNIGNLWGFLFLVISMYIYI